jgi:iron-sulfur cluster insertion protein
MATLFMTNAAADRINILAKTEANPVMLRISVQGGGCHGFQYSFDFDTKQAQDDVIFEKNGAQIVIDETSLNILDGSELDYKQELIGSSFVLINPNATSSCGCGSSFSL